MMMWVLYTVPIISTKNTYDMQNEKTKHRNTEEFTCSDITGFASLF